MSHEEVSWPLTLRQEIPNIHISNRVYYVNKGVFCLIISYLQIQSYNVLNYNNCSTDWSFPLTACVMCHVSRAKLYRPKNSNTQIIDVCINWILHRLIIKMKLIESKTKLIKQCNGI